jgi:signal transduction histidine kinase
MGRWPTRWRRKHLRRLRSHRRTARLRLTTIYGGLFLLFGAALLALTYLLARERDKPSFVELSGQILKMVPPSAVGSLHQLQTAVAIYQTGRDLNHLLVESGIAFVIMAVVAVILGWIGAGRALRPLSTITATARRISATNLHERLALEGANGEFKQLGETLDGLFARLEASFEAQRHFVVNASHELRTPLTRERTLLQVALKDPSAPEAWRSTGQRLLASNREQEAIIEALLALASSENGVERRGTIDLSIVAHAVLDADHSEIDRLGIQVDTAITPVPLAGDPNRRRPRPVG